MSHKTIGILGGMGPSTSADFYQKMIHYCQTQYNAVQDIDYPPMILYSLPLHGFTEIGIIHEKLVLEQLLKGVQLLEKSGCDFIVIPCNTVHYFITEMRNTVGIPIVSIMEETVKKLPAQKIGLLASKTTLHSKMYHQLFDKQKIEYVVPEKSDEHIITNLIFEVMGGTISTETKQKVLEIISKMNVDGIVLGCTELPIAITQQDLTIPVYNTLQILAESAVDFALEI